MLEALRQRDSASASRPGPQSRQLHADICVAEGGGTLIIEHAAGEAREDRGQSCQPWPARHISINRSGGAAKPVPENPGIDELSTTKTRSGVGRGNRQ
jgi:hypothetical protein